MKEIKKKHLAHPWAKSKAGFTLVELIVVIAVLGILSGVGAVGYSGYVKQAHKAHDIQMVGDLLYAMELAHVSDPSHVGREQMTLTTSSNPVVEEGQDKWMTKAVEMGFGQDALSNGTLKLQYDGWGDETLSTALSGMNPEIAQSVVDSTYINNVGTEKLMGDVQGCTGALADILGTSGDDMVAAVNRMNNYQDEGYRNFLEAAGYTDATGQFDPSSVTKEAMSNATVFNVAKRVGDRKGAVKAAFTTNPIRTDGQPGYAPDSALNPQDLFNKFQDQDTDTILTAANWYASGEAMVAYITKETGNREIQDMFDSILAPGSDGSVPTGQDVAGKMLTTFEEIKNKIGGDPEMFRAFNQYYIAPTDGKSQAEKDADAYIGIMETVEKLGPDYQNKDNLNDANLMTSDAMQGRLNSAVAGAAVLAGGGNLPNGGEVAIVTVNGIPNAYPNVLG